MIDSHTHLDSTPGTDAEIVKAARAVGVRRILTIGTDAASCRRAQAAAEAHDDVWFSVGHHPNSATGYGDAITDELRELARHPRCAAIGRPAWTTSATTRPAPTRSARSPPTSGSPASWASRS